MRKLHQCLLGGIAPRPIAFVSTQDEQGRVNLAPFSYFNVFSANPPLLVFSPARRGRDGSTKHTWDNVQRVPEVVVNLVDHAMVHACSLASTDYAEGVDEFVKTGLTPLASDVVSPPCGGSAGSARVQGGEVGIPGDRVVQDSWCSRRFSRCISATTS